MAKTSVLTRATRRRVACKAFVSGMFAGLGAITYIYSPVVRLVLPPVGTKALYSDWAAIGGDMRTAIKQVNEQGAA
jgi:hypothetical protein